MEDTDHHFPDSTPLNPSPGAPGPLWCGPLSRWVSTVLDAHQRWLRDLPAGRGPHSQQQERLFAQAVGHLHHSVATQLAEEHRRVDLRGFGDVFNRMPGVGTSALCRLITDKRLGDANIAWPSDFYSHGRGCPSIFLTQDAHAQEPGDSDDSREEDTKDTDSESDEERFQALDTTGRRRLFIDWACDRWHADNANALKNWTVLTNQQWFQAQTALEQVRLQAVESSVTVHLGVQWPASMLLSFDHTLRCIERFMDEHQLGACSIRWQMEDPVVPEALRSPEAYLERCRFKASLHALHERVRRLAASITNAWSVRFLSDGPRPGQQVQRDQMMQALARLEQAVQGLHNESVQALDFSEGASWPWQEDLRAAVARWQADPVVALAVSRLDIRWA